MTNWKSVALAVVRVERDAPRPSDDTFREALARDRATLHLPAADSASGFAVAGPYHIAAGGKEIDEWVVWEN